MRQLHCRPNQRVAGEEKEISARDFPHVKKVLRENSVSDEYEDARREWDFQGIIYEDDDEFVDHCELCNQPGVKKNYLLLNMENGNMLKVGSRCIKRFVILSGAGSQEESNDLFAKMEKDFEAKQRLHLHLAAVLSDLPTGTEVHRFRSASEQILGGLDQKLIKPHLWKHYIKLLFGTNNPDSRLVQRVTEVLFGKPKVKRQKLDTGEETGHWAHQIKAKKTRVETTLVNSEDYRPKKDLK